MTEEEAYNGLVSWLRRLTGIQTIRDRQQGTEPRGDFIMVNMISSVANNLPTETEFRDTLGAYPIEVVPVTDFEMRFSINVYSSRAQTIARRITQAAGNEAALQGLHPMTVSSIGDIRRLPEEIDGTFDNRAQFDMTILGVVRDGFPADIVETVNVTWHSDSRTQAQTVEKP